MQNEKYYSQAVIDEKDKEILELTGRLQSSDALIIKLESALSFCFDDCDISSNGFWSRDKIEKLLVETRKSLAGKGGA